MAGSYASGLEGLLNDYPMLLLRVPYYNYTLRDPETLL